MMKYKYILFISVLLFAACQENEYYRGPFVDDGKAPGAVSEIQVENLPGAAKITYQVPDDSDLWYVEAVYEVKKDKQAKVRSSFYNNTILVDGFGDSASRQVTLYAVDRGQNKSQPVIVHIKPLTPPVYNVFHSLSMGPTFGGVKVDFENKDSANIAINVLVIDSLNEWISAGDIFHTNRKKGDFAVRGYDSTQHTFGVYVRDRWGNLSDTLVKKIKPWYEQELDKSLFHAEDLPSDYNTPNLPSNRPMPAMWDNNYSSDNNDFTTKPDSKHPLPTWFTFSLGPGVKAKLSRLVVWTRRDDRFLYNSGAIRKFEIWGSNAPNSDGSWDSTWTYLATFEAIKPSGLPAGQNTEEDRAFADAGWQFVFPLDVPAVHYLRWKILSNWGNVSHITITEIELYGRVQ